MRGEVSIIVKVELFSDVNRFRQSSCGIQFFSSKYIKRLIHIHARVPNFEAPHLF